MVNILGFCRSLVSSAITQHLVCVTKIAIGSKYVTVTLKFEFHMIVTFSGAVTPFFSLNHLENSKYPSWLPK